MKQKLLLAITIMIACSFMIKPFAYTLSAIDPGKGVIKARLEQSTAMIQTKGKTSATSSSYTVNGAKSAVRLKIAETIFQSLSDRATASMNPADYISLYKLNAGKSNRTFTINLDGTINSALIPLSFSYIDVFVYRVGPSRGLVPGEYAFIDRSTTTAGGNLIVWTFGVD